MHHPELLTVWKRFGITGIPRAEDLHRGNTFMNNIRLLRYQVLVAAMCLAVAMCGGYLESAIGTALEESAVPRVGALQSRSLLATAAADQARATAAASIDFSSQMILQRCWTPQELLGKPEDNLVRKQRPAGAAASPLQAGPLHSPAPLPSEWYDSIRAVEIPSNGAKLIALTFDLCESKGEISGFDQEIVNTLRTHQIKATFFAGGKWMRSHPDKTQQLMADPLFEIGNHSWSHAHFALITEAEMEREILSTQAQYEVLREDLQSKGCVQEVTPAEMEKIPRIPRLFRFPYGTCNPAALGAVNRCGLAAIQWSVVTGDAARSQTAANIVRAVLQQVRPGAIIIAHANGRGRGTAAALTRIIPELRKRGYKFATVSELLASGKAIGATECYENKPHDNRRYDIKGARKIR
jgi:peptidoglycan/xylan/chitin deacetylase (PgdA/CDA1 family)